MNALLFLCTYIDQRKRDVDIFLLPMIQALFDRPGKALYLAIINLQV
jgi:hypothetical protein